MCCGHWIRTSTDISPIVKIGYNGSGPSRERGKERGKREREIVVTGREEIFPCTTIEDIWVGVFFSIPFIHRA